MRSTARVNADRRAFQDRAAQDHRALQASMDAESAESVSSPVAREAAAGDPDPVRPRSHQCRYAPRRPRGASCGPWRNLSAQYLACLRSSASSRSRPALVSPTHRGSTGGSDAFAFTAGVPSRAPRVLCFSTGSRYYLHDSGAGPVARSLSHLSATRSRNAVTCQIRLREPCANRN